MRKRDQSSEERLHARRERKRKKRLRGSSESNYTEKQSSLYQFRLKGDNRLIEKTFSTDDWSEFFSYLKREGRNISSSKDYFFAPRELDFKEKYESSIDFIFKIIFSIYSEQHKKITIDFFWCKRASQLPLFLLKIMLDKLKEDYNKINSRLNVLSLNFDVTVKNYRERNVGLNLFLSEMISEIELDNKGQLPKMSTSYIKGNSQKSGILYNLKGSICRKVVLFINEILKENGFELSPDGNHEIDGLISEILSNAEDHSPFSEYHVFANFSTSKKPGSSNQDIVGEANVFIMNFGSSIYDRLLENEKQNSDMIKDLIDQTELIQRKTNRFTEGDLYTLYSLQHGISRLKFEDESRGTGTIKFLRAFFALGDYEDKAKKYIPRITILSGNTGVYIDKKFAPYKNQSNGNWYVSLNKQKDLQEPPSSESLYALKTKFPGTLLSARMFFNRQHMLKKIKDQNGDKN